MAARSGCTRVRLASNALVGATLARAGLVGPAGTSGAAMDAEGRSATAAVAASASPSASSSAARGAGRSGPIGSARASSHWRHRTLQTVKREKAAVCTSAYRTSVRPYKRVCVSDGATPQTMACLNVELHSIITLNFSPRVSKAHPAWPRRIAAEKIAPRGACVSPLASAWRRMSSITSVSSALTTVAPRERKRFRLLHDSQAAIDVARPSTASTRPTDASPSDQPTAIAAIAGTILSEGSRRASTAARHCTGASVTSSPMAKSPSCHAGASWPHSLPLPSQKGLGWRRNM